MIFFPTQWWNTSNSHKMKENTPCQVLMTKNGKAVLMHSPATGPWFYVGTRACYWGPSASLSESNKKIPLRSPLPGFVSAFTLAHAIGSWCWISGASGARTNTKSHLDLGKHLEGNSCTEHPRLGRQGGLCHSPTTHPIAPDGQHSSESHLQIQPGSAPSSTIPFLGRRIWVSEEARRPSYHWGLLSQAGGTTNPATPSTEQHPVPVLLAAAPGQAWSPSLIHLSPHTEDRKGPCERAHGSREPMVRT